jgi:hypothetical protein
MNEQEFRASIREKITAGMSELNPLIERLVGIITDAYEKGFWAGFNIGLSVEPKEENK